MADPLSRRIYNCTGYIHHILRDCQERQVVLEEEDGRLAEELGQRGLTRGAIFRENPRRLNREAVSLRLSSMLN